MKAVIVCVSVSHGNTLRIAEAMARALGAKVVSPEEADPRELSTADLVEFGSGVFYGKLHPRLTDFVKALPAGRLPGRRDARAFVFATSGLPETPMTPFTRPLVRRLEERGFDADKGFTCRALDTWAPFKLLGGLNKRRPNADDLSDARAFAERLRDGAGSSA